MKIDLTLISVRRFLIISSIGSIIVLSTSIAILIKFGLLFYQLLGLLILGFLILYLILRKFSRFETSVMIDNGTIEVENEFKLELNSVVSYNYEESLVFAGFIFRTESMNYRLTGLLKGENGKKFKIIKENILREIEHRNLEKGIKKIEFRNFYSTRWAKLFGVTLLIFLVVFSVWIAFVMKKVNPGMIVKLSFIYLLSMTLLIRIFITKK